MKRWMVWLAAMTAGCGSEVALNSNAAIQCSNDLECPLGWVCIEAGGTCSEREIEQVVPETAPVTSVERFDTEQRYFTNVPFDLGLLDLNASFEDPEVVTLELEYALGDCQNNSADASGGGDWWPGTLSDSQPWVVDEPSVQVEPIVWRAIEDADADVQELVSAQVDTIGDGALTDVVAFIPAMCLRVRAVDETGLESPWVSTPTFALGNETPVARVVSFVNSTLSRFVPIELEISDSSSDPVTLEIQFRRGSDDIWRRANIVQGEMEDVLSSPERRSHVVVWDSITPLNPDPTVPQGIGFDVRSDLEIRVRATDSPATDVVHHSLWGEAQAVPTVANP